MRVPSLENDRQKGGRILFFSLSERKAIVSAHKFTDYQFSLYWEFRFTVCTILVL